MQTTLIEPARLSQTLADSLQDLIISQGLTPGSQLPTEPELMSQYGVSRTVVREAAAILASRGLVEVRPRKGMRVCGIKPGSLSEPMTALLRINGVSSRQLVAVRLTLETAIARDAAENRTDEDLDDLKHCLDSAENALGDASESLRLDMQFHELLVHATHNPFYVMVTAPVASLLRDMYQQSLGYLALQPDTLAEHRAIYSAVADADGDRAAQAVQTHLTRVDASLALLLKDLKSESDKAIGVRPPRNAPAARSKRAPRNER